MATHSSFLTWRNLWTEEPSGLPSMGSHSRTRLKRLSMYACTGEGNGNPLQYSCLENPRYRGAWWAAVCGAAQSWTQLKPFSSSSSSSSSFVRRYLSSKVAYHLAFPPAICDSSYCSTNSPAFSVLTVSDVGHSNMHVGVYHCCLFCGSCL